MINFKFAIIAVVLAYGFISSTSFAEDNIDVDVVWVQELEGKIKTRVDMGKAEVDMGVDWSNQKPSTCIIATFEFLYVIDSNGEIKNKIPLEYGIKNINNKNVKYREYASTSYNGGFYLITRVITTGGASFYTNHKVYNSNNQLKFEIVVEDLLTEKKIEESLGNCRIAPNSDYLVCFSNEENVSKPSLTFFDMDGNLTNHRVYDEVKTGFTPWSWKFTMDGQFVIMNGFKNKEKIIYNKNGDVVEKNENFKDYPVNMNERLNIERISNKIDLKLKYKNEEQISYQIRSKLDIKKGFYVRNNSLHFFKLRNFHDKVK